MTPYWSNTIACHFHLLLMSMTEVPCGFVNFSLMRKSIGLIRSSLLSHQSFRPLWNAYLSFLSPYSRLAASPQRHERPLMACLDEQFTESMNHLLRTYSSICDVSKLIEAECNIFASQGFAMCAIPTPPENAHSICHFPPWWLWMWLRSRQWLSESTNCDSSVSMISRVSVGWFLSYWTSGRFGNFCQGIWTVSWWYCGPFRSWFQ